MTIAVLGAGPHGREIARVLRRRDRNVRLFDDSLDDFEPLEAAERFRYVAGAVWPSVRRSITAKVKSEAHQRGTIVFPGSQVSPDSTIGEHTHLLYNTVISHGCQLGDYVTICSGAVLCGEVTVEDEVFIGANATVIHGGITIGAGAMIGAGAVVINDVPPGATVVGAPARDLDRVTLR